MEDYKYIIIGGGMTGSAALLGIREVDPVGSIALFGVEDDPPYNRPPLTKGLWKGKPLDQIFRKIDFSNLKIFLGRNIEKLDPNTHSVVDDQGNEYHYKKLLLATGGTPRKLPFGEQDIIYYRTLQDYRNLRAQVDSKQRFVVIGGGFIGSEIAAAIKLQGKDVTMIFPEEGIGWRVFPPDLSAYVTEYYRQKGVEVLTGEEVIDVRRENGKILVATRNQGNHQADCVIAGIGIQPNIQLAQSAGIQVDRGILVNESLQTNLPDIFSAGDVAVFYNPDIDSRMRVEHEDNANSMGKMAGRNMAGANDRYEYLPMFYSDLFDLGYEAVGKTDPQFQVISDWQEPFRKGVIYYVKDGQVEGVLLWNVWNKVNAARALIAEKGKIDPLKLKGKIS